jgi:hypothetical protein
MGDFFWVNYVFSARFPGTGTQKNLDWHTGSPLA